jgi:hypothetical protein
VTVRQRPGEPAESGDAGHTRHPVSAARAVRCHSGVRARASIVPHPPVLASCLVPGLALCTGRGERGCGGGRPAPQAAALDPRPRRYLPRVPGLIARAPAPGRRRQW